MQVAQNRLRRLPRHKRAARLYFFLRSSADHHAAMHAQRPCQLLYVQPLAILWTKSPSFATLFLQQLDAGPMFLGQAIPLGGTRSGHGGSVSPIESDPDVTHAHPRDCMSLYHVACRRRKCVFAYRLLGCCCTVKVAGCEVLVILSESSICSPDISTQGRL